MFIVNPPLAAISLAPVPVVVFVAARYGRRSRPALQEVQQRLAELTDLLAVVSAPPIGTAPAPPKTSLR